jgi:capsular exopolysaccharide synthesis family protein
MSAQASVPPAAADTVFVAEPDTGEVKLLHYWQVLWSRRWQVVAVAVAALVAALAVSLLTTPRYRAASVIQIERDAMKVVDVEGLTPVESPADRDFYQTQYELLRSRSLAERVVRDLQLVRDPTFARVVAKVDAQAAKERPGAAVPPRLLEAERARAVVAAVQQALSIEPIRNSRLVRIAYDSPSPQVAARVANAYADAFIDSTLQRRVDASAYAGQYLEERLAQLKARLENSEKDLVRFSTDEQIVAIGEGKPSLPEQSLGDINTALTLAEQNRIRAESMWRQASTGSSMGLPQVVANPLIQRLREQRAVAEADYRNKLTTYKPDYPEMLRLNAQIAELDQQIKAEVGNIRTSIDTDYRAATAQEDMLRGRVNALTGAVLDQQRRSIQYNILKREAETNREIYDALLQRYKQIGVASGVGINNISIVDRADVPDRKASPRLALNLAAGLVLGGVAGVLLAFLLNGLERGIRSPEQLGGLSQDAVLGVVPRLPANQTPAQAIADTRSPFTEAYRSVRTALQFSTSHGVPHSLFITSTRIGEGKSTTAAELARNIAQLGKQVVLVDADMRVPSQRAPGEIGLSNLLAGAAEIDQIVQHPADRNYALIASGPLPPSPPELLAGDRLPQLLAYLNAHFDVVIIDGPPVMNLADAVILAHHAEATLVVVGADGQTGSDALRQTLARLRSVHARVIGLVMTQYKPKAGSPSPNFSYHRYEAKAG